MSRARWLVGFGAMSTTAAAAIALGAIATGIVWLQTPSGMQRVLLPAASSLTGLDIQARKGRARWTGRVRLLDLRIASPDGWVLSARDVSLDVQPWSLASPRPVIRQALVGGARLEFRDFRPPHKDHRTHDESKLPVAIAEATVNDASVEVWSRGRLQLRLRDVDIGVDDLRRGGTGRVSVAAPALQVAPHDPEAEWAGQLLGFVEVDETADAGLTWTLSGGATLWPPTTPEDAVTFDARADGSATAQQVDGSGTITASWRGQTEGVVSGKWEWRPAERAVQAALRMADLGPAFLNPLLATRAPVRLDSGVVDGLVELQPGDEEVAFTSSIQGHQLVLRAAGTGDATPALDVDSRQSGTWSPASETFTLATTTVDVSTERARVASLSLDRALAFHLGKSEHGGDSPEARLSARLQTVPASQLRPWAALLGLAAMDAVDRGNFSGEATAVVRDEGAAIDIDGKLRARDLYLWREGDAVGPFSVDSTSTAAVADLRLVTIESSRTRLRSGGSEIAGLDGSGTAELDTGKLDLTLAGGADDVVALGRALRLVPRWAETERGGSLVGRVSLGVAGRREPVVVAGSATFDEGGVIGIDGSWPRTHGEGRVEFTLTGIDLAPWMRAWRWVTWPGFTRAPLEGSVVVTGRPGDVRVGGRQTIGPMRLPIDATRTESVHIVVEPRFDLRGRVAEGWVDLTGLRAGVAKERVHLAASTDLSAHPGLVHGSGSFSNVDFDVYSNAALGLEERAQPTELKDLLTTRMPVDFNVTMQLDAVRLWGVALDSGSFRMRSRGGNLRVDLSRSRFSGGDLEGFVDLHPVGAQPGIEYQLDGKEVDVGRLLAFFDPHGEPAMVGQGDITVSGRGRGRGQALVDDLQGRVDFDVRDGALLGSGLLGYIARVTTVGQFDGMNFTELTGRVLIADGMATLENILAISPRSKLHAVGTVGLSGDWLCDVQVQPAVNGGIASGLAHLVGNSKLIGEDGYTLLPMSILVTGPTGDLNYAVTRRVGTEEATGIGKVGGDLLKGIFGLAK